MRNPSTNEAEYAKLSRLEEQISLERRELRQITQRISELRVERAAIYEQNAAQDVDIAKTFDDFKSPSPQHYEAAKPAIKLVYYTLRESKNGLRIDELIDTLSTPRTREEGDIRDAAHFLHDAGYTYLRQKDCRFVAQKK